jgi:hypothetical protein
MTNELSTISWDKCTPADFMLSRMLLTLTVVYTNRAWTGVEAGDSRLMGSGMLQMDLWVFRLWSNRWLRFRVQSLGQCNTVLSAKDMEAGVCTASVLLQNGSTLCLCTWNILITAFSILDWHLDLSHLLDNKLFEGRLGHIRLSSI